MAEKRKLLALTFDDGPSPDITPQILDVLEENRAAASFFLVGENILPAREAIVKRAVSLGCEICSHSYTHSDMTTLSAAEIRAEMDATAEKIVRLTGSAPRFFRPPYIAVNDTLFETVPLPFIAGFGVEDFRDEVTAEMRYAGVMAKARDGGIILLHDAEENVQTAAAVRRLVPDLIAAGYTLVTVSQLFDGTGITPPGNGTRILYSYAAQQTMYAE